MKTALKLELKAAAVLAVLAASAVPATAQTTLPQLTLGKNLLGTLTYRNTLAWDYDTNGPALMGFRVYTVSTNFYPLLTNSPGWTNPAAVLSGFVRVTNADPALNVTTLTVTTTTNRWPGSQSQGLNGWRFVYVTAVGVEGGESDRSEVFVVQFRAGVPLPPSNFQLYSVLTMAATNALPGVTVPGQP